MTELNPKPRYDGVYYKGLLNMNETKQLDSYALDWIKLRSLALAKSINKTTLEALRNELALGYGAGESIQKLSKRIEGYFTDNAKVRANMVSRTEIIAASNEGTLNRYEKENVEKSEFFPSPDACEVCLGIAADPIFPTKESHGIIPVHPNCRCKWLPVITEGKPILPPKEKPQPSENIDNIVKEDSERISEMGGFDSDSDAADFYYELEEKYGDMPEFQNLIYQSNSWITEKETQALFRKDIETFFKTGELNPRSKEFVSALYSAPRTNLPLYRGIYSNQSIDDIAELYRVSNNFDIPLSSFTSDLKVAEFYATQGEMGEAVGKTAIKFNVAQGSKGLPLEGFSSSGEYRSIHEWVSGGRYEVDAIRKVGAKRIEIDLIQVDIFSLKKAIPRTDYTRPSITIRNHFNHYNSALLYLSRRGKRD